MTTPIRLYTGGTFDLFHYGHANFLHKCHRISGEVVVSLNTDEFILDYKGSAPIMNYAEREKSLLYCPYVSEVVPNLGGRDSRVSILQVRPSIIAIGDDWAQKDYYKQMGFTQAWLDEHGIVLLYIPYTKGISTTELKRRILGNEN
jgi:glycerol-3-phosphate cytidylyltransferase